MGGIALHEVPGDYLPTDHDFVERPPLTEPLLPTNDDSYLDEANATSARRAKWLEERGIREDEVLQDKLGEFYYDPIEDETGVHYTKRRLPPELELIF